MGLQALHDVFEQYRQVERVLVLSTQSVDFAIEPIALPSNVVHVGPQLDGPATMSGADQRKEPPLVLISTAVHHRFEYSQA